MLSHLVPFKQDQIVVSGSVQKYGAITRLVIRVNREGLIHAWEVSDEIESMDSLPELIKDLAFKLAMMIQRNVIVAKEWEALKFLTEANASYRIYKSSGNIQNLDHAYEYCCNTLKVEKKYEKLAKMFNEIGVAYCSREQYLKAKESLHHSIEIEPEEAKHYNALGNVLLSVGLYDEAEEAFKTAISYDNKLPYPYNGLGNLHAIKGEYVKSIDKYIEAISIDNRYDSPFNNIGMIFSTLGCYKAAFNQFNQAIDLKNLKALFYCSRGWNYLHQNGKPDTIENSLLIYSIKDLKKTIYLDEEYYLSYGYLGLAYFLKEGAKWIDKAHENWKKLLELCPNKTPFERLNYALYTTALGIEDEKGIEMMEKLLHEPSIKDAYGYLEFIQKDISLISSSNDNPSDNENSSNNIYGHGLKELNKLIKEHLNKNYKNKEENNNKNKIRDFANELVEHKKWLIDFRYEDKFFAAKWLMDFRYEGKFLATKWKNIKDKYKKMTKNS